MNLFKMLTGSWFDELASANPATEGDESCPKPATVAKVAVADALDPDPKCENYLMASSWVSDERRTCLECRHLTQHGLCLAAWRGEFQGVRRDYQPVQDLPQRCPCYAPRPEDVDQRENRFAKYVAHCGAGMSIEATQLIMALCDERKS